MVGLTHEEAIGYCKSSGELRFLRDKIHLRFRTGPREALLIQTPPSMQATSLLCSQIVRYQEADWGEGSLVWLGLWHMGPSIAQRVGWRTLESIRRLHGVNASLEIAPATSFRGDELVDEQVFLTNILAFGWGGYMVSSGSPFILDFRTSERFFVYSSQAEVLDEIEGALEAWKPVRVDEASETRGSGHLRPKPLAPRERKRR